MKKIKNNQSGFTLVELIVVMALMSIVFGALMNVLKPTNQFFAETEAFKDEVMISEGLTDALSAEVRYATNVVVLKNYVGVPKLDAEGQLAGIPDVKFDSAMLIDNDQVRGYYDKDYLANRSSTVARRKGARGQIVVFEIGGIGINFNVSSILANEDYYGDYQYNFDVSGKTDENGRSYIDFQVTMNDLVKSGTSWVSSEDNYESSEFLYLKNINLKDNDGYTMIVKDFNNSTEDDDYIGFERTPVLNGVATTSCQSSLFNGSNSSNSHTWILYYKGGSIDAGKEITLSFDPGEGGLEPVNMTGYVGKAFNQVPPTFPETGYDKYESDGKVFTRRFVGWMSTAYPTEEPLTNEQIMAYIPLENETFKAVYSEADATYTVTFYDVNGTQLGEKIENIRHGESISSRIPTVSIPDDYELIWKHKGTVNDIVYFTEFDSVTNDYEVEPYFYKWKYVHFYDESGKEIYVDMVMSGCALDSSKIPEVPEKSGYTGVWVVKNPDGTTSAPNFGVINEDLEIYPKYTEIPVNKPNLIVENLNITSDWTNVKFKITNTGTANATGFKVKITTNVNVTNCYHNIQQFYYPGGTITASGNTVYLDASKIPLNMGSSIDMAIGIEPKDGLAIVGNIEIYDVTY